MSRACPGCLDPIQPEEMVMWIRDHVTGGDHVIYHARCFACDRCDGGRPLAAGEHYGIQDGRVYCRAHYCERQMERRQVRECSARGSTTSSGRRTGTRGRPRKLRTAVRPPDEPSPRPCETGAMTAETEPRTFTTIDNNYFSDPSRAVGKGKRKNVAPYVTDGRLLLTVNFKVM